MVKHFAASFAHRLLRWAIFGSGIFILLAFITSGQTRTFPVFASPLSTLSPSAPLRGIHLGNHVDAKDWDNDLLQRIDPLKGGTWPEVIVLLSWQVYDRHRSGPNCRIDSVSIAADTHASILTYLQRASIAGKRIVIRVMPSPGNFDANHRLLTTSSSGCAEWNNRSVDDVGDEIIKIHEWNMSHGITDFGFEPANEPNIEWYRGDPNPTPIHPDDPRAWSDMDVYFSAIYDYVHAVPLSPTIRILTPPMSQNAYAELKRAGRDLQGDYCVPMSLTNGNHGYTTMPNVFSIGTKNDGYDWHNYWKVGYEAWGDCDPNASPHGQHVAYQFPYQMILAMLNKPRTITEADIASPPSVHRGQFGNLSNKDELLGLTAANSLNQSINAEIAEGVAVWGLNVTDSDPETGPEQNWHEAYRCNDWPNTGKPVLERPWFTLWWTGWPGWPAFCYKTYLSGIMKDYTTELIKNGTFDAGNAYWTTTTSYPTCTNPPIFGVIDNNNAAVLARCTYNTDTLAQTITLPANVTSAQLTFKFRVEQNYSQPIYNDRLYVRMRDRTTNELVPLSSYVDDLPRGVWRGGVSSDLTARKGHTLDVIFTATNDNDLRAAKFWIDDVSVQVTQ